MNFARASIAAAAAASALALFAPAAGAQVPSIELPPLPDVAGINAAAPDSAISGQYHEIAAAVEKALPPVPAAAPVVAPPAAPPPAPKPAAEYHPKAPQYHSEAVPDVSVTQTQPSNVNVSIRINSPGDDGPVVQVNGAGADVVTNVVNHITDAPDPGPADSGVSGLPDDWTWIWTSACFGGGASAPAGAAAASGGPQWDWQWSCDQDVPAGVSMPGPDTFPGLGPISDPVAAAALPPPLDAFALGQADTGEAACGATPPRARARHGRRQRLSRPADAGHRSQPADRCAAGRRCARPSRSPRSAGAAARHAVQARARPARSDDRPQHLPLGRRRPRRQRRVRVDGSNVAAARRLDRGARVRPRAWPFPRSGGAGGPAHRCASQRRARCRLERPG